MMGGLKLSVKSIVLPTSGALTPVAFLIVDLLVLLKDLGQEEYARVWIKQLKIAQTTDKFNEYDAIVSLEAATKRTGGGE